MKDIDIIADRVAGVAELIKEMIDLARNVGGLDENFLYESGPELLRSTMRDWRDEARAILDKIDAAPPPTR